MNQLIIQNAECLATLVGVVLYEHLKGITASLGIGFAAPLFGAALTGAGVIMTLISKKDWRGKGTALAIHGVLWLFKGLVAGIAGFAIAGFIIYYCFMREGRNQKPEERREMTIQQLPAYLYSGSVCYGRSTDFGWGVEHVNASDPSDKITITSIIGATASEVSTNAGHFYF